MPKRLLVPTSDHLPQRIDPQKGLNEPLTVDERVWEAFETNRLWPNGDGSTSLHRIQRIIVRRGEYEKLFEKDLGPSTAFPLANPAHFIAWNEYSVGEVLEIMPRLREDQPEPEEPHDLFQLWLRDLDEKRQQRAHRSVIGPGVRIQRD